MNKTVLFFFLLILITYSSYSKQDKLLADSSGWTPVNGYFEQKYHVGAFQKVKLAADPRYLLTYSSDSMFRKWEISPGTLVYEKKVTLKNYIPIDFTNDEKYFLFGFNEIIGDSLIKFYFFDIENNILSKQCSLNIYHENADYMLDSYIGSISNDKKKAFINIIYTNAYPHSYSIFTGTFIFIDIDSSIINKSFELGHGYLAISPNSLYSSLVYEAYAQQYSWIHQTVGFNFLDNSLNMKTIYSNESTSDNPKQLIYYGYPYFSPTSDILLTNSNNDLYLWNVSDLKQIDSINLPNYYSSRICTNNDLIIYYSQESTHLINIYVRSLRKIFKLYDLDSGSVQPNNLYLLPVSDSAFVGYGIDGVLRLFNVPDEKELSVNDKNMNYDIKVFPNPFSSQLNVNITLPQSEFVKFSIYDELGQEVATFQDNDFLAGSKQFNIDFSDKSIGVYFYKLQIGTNVYTGTLIHYR
jgi:hypothetical protein